MQPGTRLGPYEIVSLLGAGGMGEVYRARDTKLGRDVALKILPPTFASDPDRLARFEREAHTLASLNHPHIAQIYGLETGALVMELAEGQDLSERIAGGPIPVDDALPIARQIAEALEAAHDQGIVHRDLKPANIKVRDSGAVKVLDFGLAKAVEGASGAGRDDVLNSPTITSPAMTRAGVILGTAAYMSPEQARGKSVDKRADIWAFGCVLYEMLTGRRAFGGDSITDTLSAITRDDPDWRALPGALPANVRRILERTLIKDPTQRLRDIGEARIALADPSTSVEGRPGRASYGWVLPASALVALAAAAGGFFLGQRQLPATAPVMVSFTQLTEQPGVERQPTISPDGRSVVYVSDARGNDDLYLLRVGGRNAVLLTADSPTDDYAPSFSRDGNRIAFRSERDGGGIFIMEATGESVRRISNAGYDPDWSPDGTTLVVAQEGVRTPTSRISDSVLSVISISDGTRRELVRRDAVGPKWSPTGKRIVYWGLDSQGQRDIYTVAADGSDAQAARAVTADDAIDWSPTWSADGRFIYFGSNRGGTMNLWRVAVDEATGEVRGTPEPLTTPTAWSGWFDISDDGATVYSNLDDRSTLFVVDFDPQKGAIVGQPRVVLQARGITSIDLSADGRRVAFSQQGQPWEWLGVIATDGSGWARLTDDDYYHRLPAWSPDGRRLIFYMNRGGQALWTLQADGGGLTQLEMPGQRENRLRGSVYPVWSPDGGRIVYATNSSIEVVDMQQTPLRVVATLPNDRQAFLPSSWSRDGRAIALSGRSLANRDQLWVINAALENELGLGVEGKSPIWLPDSKRVLFAMRNNLLLIDVATKATEVVVPNIRIDRTFWGRLLSLSRDGRTLAYLESQSDGDIWLMKEGR